MASRTKRRTGKHSFKAKGSIAEEIAAWLHDWPGVKVERNVQLAAQNDPTRKREIDVLLTTTVVGYEVRFAVECKNEASPIGSPKIDGFVGKLQDVGIPPQQGIFISASGYTKGAARRAEKAGIRALLLRGLSTNGLKASISTAAHESLVFFLVVVDSVSFVTKSAEPEIPIFVDASGRLCGTVPHLIASHWRNGKISTKPGAYDLSLDVPEGWRVIEQSSGRPDELVDQKIHVHLKACALAMTRLGKAEQYSLVDSSSSHVQKLGVKVFFDAPEARYPLTVFEEPAALDHFLGSREGLRITHRVKVPRIRYHTAYWPLSRKAAERIREMSRTPQFVGGDLAFPALQEVEGFDVAAAWETPMSIE
ncbi:MAG: restriction endonuclease, partial [Vicinamibacteria bacterium]